MNMEQDVRIVRWKDGKNDGFGRIIETVGSDCYKVQLYDDVPHLVNQYRVFHESWLVETKKDAVLEAEAER